MSRVSKASKMSKQSTIVGGATSKVGKTPLKKEQTSNTSKLGKMVEFAEDSAEDYESSDKSSDEEEKKRKWAENLYYYNCPVFRVSIMPAPFFASFYILVTAVVENSNFNNAIKRRFCLITILFLI